MKQLLNDLVAGVLAVAVGAFAVSVADGASLTVAATAAAVAVLNVLAKALNPKDESYGVMPRKNEPPHSNE